MITFSDEQRKEVKWNTTARKKRSITTISMVWDICLLIAENGTRNSAIREHEECWLIK
jgi:hypothetical protein